MCTSNSVSVHRMYTCVYQIMLQISVTTSLSALIDFTTSGDTSLYEKDFLENVFFYFFTQPFYLHCKLQECYENKKE